MATARDVVKRALRQIGELASGEDPTAEDAADTLAALNGMVAGWTLEGVNLGLPELALADTINLPLAQIDAIIFNLAVQVAPEYGATIGPALSTMAERGKSQLQRTYLYVPKLGVDPTAYRPRTERWR